MNRVEFFTYLDNLKLLNRLIKNLKDKINKSVEDLVKYLIFDLEENYLNFFVNLLSEDDRKKFIKSIEKEYDINAFVSLSPDYVEFTFDFNLLENKLKKFKHNNFAYKKTHKTWYKKWNITDDLSIRYFYLFEDRPMYENRWFIKSHKNKTYEEISKEYAEKMINSLGIEPVEIIGYKTKCRFTKLIIKDDKVEFINE